MSRTEAQKETQRRWREAHPNYWREWRAAHAEERARQMREWRAEHPDVQAEYDRATRQRYPERIKARNAVNNAIVAGTLARGSCEVCSTTDEVHAHHEDYSKPLDVRWLCKEHHMEVHAA